MAPIWYFFTSEPHRAATDAYWHYISGKEIHKHGATKSISKTIRVSVLSPPLCKIDLFADPKLYISVTLNQLYTFKIFLDLECTCWC